MTRTKRTATFAELRDGDGLLDANGVTWNVSQVWHDEPRNAVGFTITHLTEKSKTHRMVQPATKAATILREQDVTSRAAAFLDGDVQPAATQHDAAVEAAQEGLGAAVVTEVTTAEQQAADDATEDAPAQIKAFEDMTDLEQRSHIYVLHSDVWPKDTTHRRERVADHAAQHAAHAAGTLKSRGWKPHTHSEPEGKK